MFDYTCKRFPSIWAGLLDFAEKVDKKLQRPYTPFCGIPMSAHKLGVLLRFVLAVSGLVLALQSYFLGIQISVSPDFTPDSSSNPPIFSDPGWSNDSDDSGGWDFGGGDDSGWDSSGGDSGSWDSGGGDSGSWDSGGGDSGSW
jgi:hypothetical protein